MILILNRNHQRAVGSPGGGNEVWDVGSCCCCFFLTFGVVLVANPNTYVTRCVAVKQPNVRKINYIVRKY